MGDEKKVRKNLLGIALPVAFSTYVRSGLLTLEHTLIPIGLRKSGASKERSLAAYGTLNSMVFPVILFPSALISSFAGMTIPELSDCLAKGHRKRIAYISTRVWQFLTYVFYRRFGNTYMLFRGARSRALLK